MTCLFPIHLCVVSNAEPNRIGFDVDHDYWVCFCPFASWNSRWDKVVATLAVLDFDPTGSSGSFRKVVEFVCMDARASLARFSSDMQLGISRSRLT